MSNAITAVLKRPWPGRVSGRTAFEAAFILLLLATPILLYLPFAGTPFERDEGVYATIAQGLLDGHVPYRDLFDNKPPLVYVWYAISFSLFGESVIAPRVVAALFLSLTGLVVYSQARLVLPRGAAYAAAILFAISTGLPWVALHANTEAYLLLPLMGSLMFFTYGMKKGHVAWFFVSGLLAGLAIMTKQVAMWNLLALALVALIWYRRTAETQLDAIKPVGALFAGTLLSLGAITLPFALVGALDDFLYANLSYNWVYVGVISNTERLVNLGYGMAFFGAIAAPFIAGALAGLFVIWKRRASTSDYVLILWAIASAIGVASGGRFFPHYFLQLMPSLAVLTGVLIYDRFANGSNHVLSKPAWMIALFLIVVSVGTATVLYTAPREAEQRVVASVYNQKEWEASSKELGEYIKARTAPDDVIFNYGRESQVYFYADRLPAIPYLYDWVLRYDEDAMDKIVAGVRETKPVYIIDSLQAPLIHDWNEAHPPEFMQVLQEDYEYTGRIYFADVYRLKGYSPEPPSEVKAGSLELNPLVTDEDPFQ